MKRFVLGLAALGAGLLALSSCTENSTSTEGGENGGSIETGKLVENGKIGFILAGSAGKETAGFQAHWEALGKQYGVEMIYEKFQGQDPAYYGECADKLIAAGANAIICNFEMDGKDAVIEKCVDEEIYIGYSGSTVAKDVFEEYKNNPYFIGQIAPFPETEEKAAYDMTKYLIDKFYGPNKVALPEGTSGKLAVWPVDFHGLTLEHQMTYRWKGIKRALAEYGVTVVGDENDDSAGWSATYSNDSVLKDKIQFLGNNMGNFTALQQQCAGILETNPSVVVSTCMADMLLNQFATKGSLTKGTNFGTLDSFGNDYAKWYKADPEAKVAAFRVEHDPYVAGKFSAINEAIVALTCRAFEGKPVRGENNEAVSVNQTYWISKTLEEFEAAQATSEAFSWTKAEFDAIKNESELQALYDNATLENLSKRVGK